ncbi:MAG: sugar phosphate isomerase/epimerase [Victivallales bacterium]|nr:sugar phosphate isomerase/epimerase [Victivallales bacterium]
MQDFCKHLGSAAWGLRETPLEEQFALCRRLGLSQLELSIGNGPKDWVQPDSPEELLEKIALWREQYGVGTICGCTGNDFTAEGDLGGDIAHVKAATDTASRLGIRYLRIFAGFTSDSLIYGARLERMLDALKAVAEHGAERGMVIAVETHGGVTPTGDGSIIHFQSPSTRADIWPMILATGCRMLFDPANLNAAGHPDTTAFLREFRDAVAYVHLKDFADVPGGVRPAAIGEGRMKVQPLLDEIRALDCPVMLEYEMPGDIADGLQRSLDLLKTCVR